YANGAAAEAIHDIAELHRKTASDNPPPAAGWGAADRAARALHQALDAASRYAVRAAYQSTAPVDTDHWTTLDVVTGNALRAHALATGFAPGCVIELARHAIRSWRRLAGMDSLPVSAAA
ncbi:MAG: hypothetical protein ACRDTV_17760, partial [Mycobacterium sp.]